MQLSPLQIKVMQRIANSSDGEVLLSIFEAINNEISDLRTIEDPKTTEKIEARDIAAKLVQREFIDRLKIRTIKGEKEEIIGGDQFA